MSGPAEPLTDFERQARGVLEESVRRIDARTRSKLNQARQAALAAAQPQQRSWLRSFTLMPAGAAAAAVLVALTLWYRQPGGESPLLEGQHTAVEDMDLLADSEGLDLMEGGDGSFYEWAVAQSDNAESEG